MSFSDLNPHDQIVEMLKFTPVTYRVSVYGYGAEVVMGKVSKKAYDYFVQNDIDLSNYAIDPDEFDDLPEGCNPFGDDGAMWFDCDDIAHIHGPYMDSYTMIVVSDENEDTVWEHCMDVSMLCETMGDESVTVSSDSDDTVCGLSKGTVIYIGEEIAKGAFIEADLELTSPFDYKKFSFIVDMVNDVEYLSSIVYDGNELESIDMGTTGKSSDHQFVEL